MIYRQQGESYMTILKGSLNPQWDLTGFHLVYLFHKRLTVEGTIRQSELAECNWND